MQTPTSRLALLIVGDLVTVLIVTVAGFATHDELGSAGARMLTTFAPLTVAWLMSAPWLGLFQLEVARRPSNLWRVLPAALLAGPLAAVLRGVWLNGPVIPVFALVLVATTALAMLIWRAIWLGVDRLLERGKQVLDG